MEEYSVVGAARQSWRPGKAADQTEISQQEGLMPNASNGPEADAVEAAYQAHVQTLFRSLVTNLGDQAVSHQSDQQCLDKFTVGLNIAKRAKRLAFNVVGPASPAKAAAIRSSKHKEQPRHRRRP
jgi:hypothetical protein